MRNIMMARGADTVVRRCAGVSPGEQVVIVTEPSRTALAEALAEQVCARGAEPTVLFIVPRERDGQEPRAAAAAAGAFVPTSFWIVLSCTCVGVPGLPEWHRLQFSTDHANSPL